MQKIRTVIIGLGAIAHGYDDDAEVLSRIKYPTHLSAIKKNKKFILVGGSDPSLKAQKSFQTKVSNSVTIYSDYRKMIIAEKPALVVVATPTNTHVKICRDIIKLGVKNILCEKPISYFVPSAQALVNLAERKGVKLSFNYFRVYNRRYRKLIKSIKDKKFGAVRFVNVKYYKGIYNDASHAINLLEQMFGPVRKVKAMGKLANSKDSKDPNINFKAELDGVMADFKSVPSNKTVINIYLKFTNKAIRIFKDRSREFPLGNVGMLDVYNSLYQSIALDKEIGCNGKDALHALIVAAAVIQSFKIKKAILL